MRYAAIWEQQAGSDWQARHGLSRSQYQQTFDQMATDGFAPVQVRGYRVNVDVRFAAIWERRPGVEWIGRHGLTSSEYQKAFDEQLAAGFRLNSQLEIPSTLRGPGFNRVIPAQAGIQNIELFDLSPGVRRDDGSAFLMIRRIAATWSLFMLFYLVSLNGYSDTGIARYAAIWYRDEPREWQARHGLDAANYQWAFDDLAARGFRPVQVSGYGDGFYPA